MFGVGEALEEAVGGAQGGKSDFWPADQRGETIAVAFAGLAKEDCFNGAAGAQGLFDKANALDADGARFRGQTAAERQAELFEPAIVAAGEDPGRGCTRAGIVSGGFAWSGHQGERNKFRG
jgi:hypothetical protein